ncbi:TetR/AcrR family transcriptional regulator [Micromonospora sp. NPDC018662]|uniref:TetR/AcrR family transcriptional regulator n=1 Tax=Micromonospora sp. NPDC018662 TaxID=3364238 RepID=UPI0037BE193F
MRSRPARGTGPGAGAGALDRDRIVAALLRLLDADGVDRFSMRRLAADLNVTPMSLYWYVDNKDDLLELALDAVAGEIELPDPAAGHDWRDDLRLLATAWRRVMVAHPWALRCYGEYLNIGPQSVRFARCARAVIARSPLPPTRWSTALSAVFQYVYGFTVMESRWIEGGRAIGRTADEFFSEVADSVTGVPGVEAAGGLLEQRGGLTLAQIRDQDFHRTLDWLIAGMTAAPS